ncbi:hypothetical protein GDO78_017442 [Eleutherodactylus coqui]|uniref:Uncharacterized protein n=1 Tax=Eleutherodactylus coqui TaxID=57060 RepID=A0A8J6JYF3_ELECQ|nr:hypothetical protein GDO78_017442 [Eleutherodactylus coqui]
MSDGSLPVRRIGTRAAVRQEASNMAESDASSSSEPAPSTTQNTDTSDDSPMVEPKLEFKEEPMDTSPPAESTEQLFSIGQITPTLATATLQLKDSVILAPLGPSPFTGVPRQSIFFSCRGELGSDRMSTSASPRPTSEISIMSPLVSTSPAQLSFVHVTEDAENGERSNDVTQNLQIKTFPEAWPAVKEVCTLVATQNLIPTQQTIVTSPPEILPVKQEFPTTQPVVAPARSESQNSVSSPEGSVGNPAGQTEWNAEESGGGGSNNSSPPVPVVTAEREMVQLKVENEEGDSQDAGKASPAQLEDRDNWQENQDEWDRQSHSPQPSENAQDDSLPSSSSQDGDPSSVGELPTNGDFSFDPDVHKPPWRSNMNRLLELEEQWDQLYHRELGIWEEERIQQQQQRNQDRELQQQLLSVLTDIRDELRQLRQERAAARQSQAASTANGSPMVTNTSPTAAETPKPNTESPAAAETPAKSTPVVTAKRRGRPRLIRPAPEPVRPIRPAPKS